MYLVTGATGQIGVALVPALRSKYGDSCVLSCINRTPAQPVIASGLTVTLDVTDRGAFERVIVDHKVTVVYHLASLLSATSEMKPDVAWKVNLDSLRYLLDLAVKHNLRVFFPSSIGVFGSTSGKHPAQRGPLEPTSLYGVLKVAAENLCNYYHEVKGVDVRSLRYPGIISSEAPPGGGTTDFAVNIFHSACAGQVFECPLSADTSLPMMYMSDCVQSAIALMEAPAAELTVWTSYNVLGFSVSPRELADVISQQLPEFQISYEAPIKMLQTIADSWPDSVDDSQARADWAWSPSVDLAGCVTIMLQALKH